MVKVKGSKTWHDLYYKPKIELCLDTLYSKKQTLYYLDRFIYYRDSLNLIKYYLKRHKHLINDDLYRELMYYVERKYVNEIPVKSHEIWF